MNCYNCPGCGKEIVKDLKKYLKKYPDENWMQCCYCGIHIPIMKVPFLGGYLYDKKEVKKE